MSTLRRHLAFVAPALLGLFALVVRAAVRSWISTWLASVLLPLVAIALVVAGFEAMVALGPMATDEEGHERPLLRRHGFWLVLLSIVVGLPLLGAYSLVDPWETHYAEVAREMLERHDFISPWWANEGWFLSKPVLLFWLEAASMWIFGVRAGADQTLWDGHALLHPEYAVRLPGFLLAVAGLYALYNGVSRVVSRRAGLLAALVLLTTAGYALLAHQAITDMPMLATVAAACGFLLRALDTKDEAVDPLVGRVAAAAFLACTLPQMAILLSAHVHLGAHPDLVLDHLRAGSPHSCTLPGQPACAEVPLAFPRLQPFVQMCFWLPAIVLLAVSLAREARISRAFALAAWMAASFGAMAKGPVGLVIPAAGAIVAIVSRRSLRPLLRLELPRGLAIAVVMIAPWYVAQFARLGHLFIDELIYRHMFGRTLEHLHDTNAGEDVGLVYFVKQLGYALFPWSGVAALAMVGAGATGGSGGDDRSRRGHARALLFGSALASYGLVSIMGTKFHHYGLIAVPGIAGVTGMWLDEQLTDAASRRSAHRRWSTALSFGAATVVTLLVARDFVSPATGTARFFHLLTYRYDRHWVSTGSFAPVIAVASVVVALAIAAHLVRRLRARATTALVACAVVFSAFLTSVYLVRGAHDGGQRGILEAYYRARTNDPAAKSPVVAYQLNWKGENFYTANDVAIFISSGAPMRTYLDRLRAENGTTVFFITERGRLGGLRGELGNVHVYQEITDRSVSDEFALVRVEL